jgi:hypothetical protein
VDEKLVYEYGTEIYQDSDGYQKYYEVLSEDENEEDNPILVKTKIKKDKIIHDVDNVEYYVNHSA